MSTTLEVILKTAGFTEGATAIKKVGDEATNTNNKLKTTTSTVDQVSKSTTSLGSKLANAGKQFSGTITNVAALGSTVVNLNRQYQDLTDSQIRVDRSGLKVSKTTEAVGKAQAKLSGLMAKGITSGQAYEAAQLDIKQALEAQDLATRNLTEATEDHQRAQENFWMGLAPTILTAGSSVTSALKEIGGEKGIGGLVTKLKTLPASLNMSGKAFAGMAGSIGIASIALVELFDQIKRGADIKELQKLNETIGATSETIDKEISQLKAQKNSWGQALKDFFFAGPIGQKITGMPSGGFVIDEVIKSLESKQSRDKGIAAFKNLLVSITSMEADPDLKSHAIDTIKKIIAIYTNDNNWKAGYGGTAQQVRDNTVNNFLIPAFKSLETDSRLLPIINQIPTGLTGALRAAFLKVNPFAGLMGETLTAAINASPTSGSDWIGAAKKKFEAQIAAGKSMIFGGGAGTSTGIWASVEIDADKAQKAFDDVAKASKDAADKITADEKAAAVAYMAAWQKAFDSQSSGIDKIFAAYHKLHPGGTEDIMKKGKKIGERTFTPGQLPIDIAQKALDQLESGMAQLISSPKSAETWAQNWVKTAGSKLGGVAGQLIKPINDYIKEHASEAPDTFMSGFIQFLDKFNLTDAFSKAFMPMVTVAGGATDKVVAKIGTIPPAVEKVKPPLDLIAKTLKNIGATKLHPVIKIDVNLAQANAKWNAFVKKVEMTTLQVKIAGTSVNIRKGSQAGAYGGPKQHGYQSTVHRPTMFLAGEGGRPEDVTVRPRGSVQRGGSGGGGFNGTINVYVDGVLRPARYDMGARK